MSTNSKISQKTLKKLYAKSHNICAMYGCDKNLFDPDTGYNSSIIAHIEGEKTFSARYNAKLSEKEVHDYDNLILLCPNHHTEIDAKENEKKHTVKYLKKMKKDHEDLFAYQEMLKPPKDREIPPRLVNGIMDKYNITHFRELDRYEVSNILNFVLRENIITRFILYSIIINSRVEMCDINLLQVLNQVNAFDEEEKAKQLMILEKNGFFEEHYYSGSGDGRLELNNYGGFDDCSEKYGLKLYSGKWCYGFKGKIIYAWYEMLKRDKIKFYNALIKENICV